MPTINIYYKSDSDSRKLQPFIPKLKKYLAEKLTCGDIKLTPAEISIRFILTQGGEMIGNVELEITAYAFPERVEKQDEICNEVRQYIQENYPSIGEVRVWLILAELGHSW